jgi:mono/diheme cytochrome c family protein
VTGIILRIVAPAVAVFGIASLSYAANDTLVPAMGHGIALQLCTTCHLVEPGQVNPPGHVGGPSFQTIANSEAVSEEKLRRHFNTLNRRTTALSMPNIGLTRDERTKVIAYIMSLRNPQAPADAPAQQPPAPQPPAK